MVYRIAVEIVVDADFIRDYRLQSSRRVKIAENVTSNLGWREGDRIFELVDEKKKVVILVKKDDFERLLRNGIINIVEGPEIQIEIEKEIEKDRWIMDPEITRELEYLITQKQLGMKMHRWIRQSIERLRELGYPEEKIRVIEEWFK